MPDTSHPAPAAPRTTAEVPTLDLDLDAFAHPVLSRLIEEVRDEQLGRPGAYNRTHNRHNRSR